MPRKTEYEKPIELTAHGMPLAFYQQFNLNYVDDSQSALPPYSPTEATNIFRQANPGVLEDRFEDLHCNIRFKWDQEWFCLKLENLMKAFTLEELLRFQHCSSIMSDISEEMHTNPKYMIFRKIKSSLCN